jgi:hypothetical protein
MRHLKGSGDAARNHRSHRWRKALTKWPKVAYSIARIRWRMNCAGLALHAWQAGQYGYSRNFGV